MPTTLFSFGFLLACLIQTINLPALKLNHQTIFPNVEPCPILTQQAIPPQTGKQDIQVLKVDGDSIDPESFFMMDLQVNKPADTILEARLYALNIPHLKPDQQIFSIKQKLKKPNSKTRIVVRSLGPNVPEPNHYPNGGFKFQVILFLNEIPVTVVDITVDEYGNFKWKQSPFSNE